jgi:hypothetical protein
MSGHERCTERMFNQRNGALRKFVGCLPTSGDEEIVCITLLEYIALADSDQSAGLGRLAWVG